MFCCRWKSNSQGLNVHIRVRSSPSERWKVQPQFSFLLVGKCKRRSVHGRRRSDAKKEPGPEGLFGNISLYLKLRTCAPGLRVGPESPEGHSAEEVCTEEPGASAPGQAPWLRVWEPGGGTHRLSG